jgi:pilus assembly protein Flp/PilA
MTGASPKPSATVCQESPMDVEVRNNERGASIVEYAMLLALIAIVCVVAVTALGTGLNDSYGSSTSSMFGG